jgi:plasmid stability protein
MASNLTITVDEEALRKARVRALSHGTSVNALLRDFLEAYAGVRSDHRAAVTDLVQLSHQASSRRGDQAWSRGELHDRSGPGRGGGAR